MKEKRYEDWGERGKYDRKNNLNNLTGKEWLLFTKSWKVYTPRSRSEQQIQHPAKFPQDLALDFISFFTKKEQLVLDCFLGTGTSARACRFLNRRFIGLELNKNYCKLIKKELSQKNINSLFTLCKIIHGDARNILTIWKKYNFELVDYIITSPPYWNMLKKSRGNSNSTHSDRLEKGLPLYYSDDDLDLGNIDDYELFLSELTKILLEMYNIMKDKAYMTIIIQNIRIDEGYMIPLAFDIVRKLSKKFYFISDKLWLQDDKKMGIWGYPYEYCPNTAHHYCLTFRKKENNK